MVRVTRRTFIEGAAALPAAPAYASAIETRYESDAAPGIAPRQLSAFRLFLGGLTAVREDRLLLQALRMFPSALESFEVQSRMNSAAALWALAAHGNGLTCSPCREFANAVLDGLPLVSVAQIAAGPDRSVMVSDQDDASLDDMRGARLLVRDEMDRQRWEEVARARRWHGYTFVNAPGPLACVVACGAARAALVSAYDRSILERRKAPVRFMDVDGLERAPSVCAVAHRRSVTDPVSARSVRLVLNALVAAVAIERRAEQRGSGSALPHGETPAVVAPDSSGATISQQTARLSNGPWLPRRFGVHDAHAWRSLVSHAIDLRAMTELPSDPVWVNACLPSGVSRRLALG